MSDRTDPRVETIREHERFMWSTAENAPTDEKRKSAKQFDAALASLAREAQLARAVVEAAAVVRYEFHGRPEYPEEMDLRDALAAYRAEFPNPVKTDS